MASIFDIGRSKYWSEFASIGVVTLATNGCFRYRKKHLFLEPQYESGKEGDHTALFTADFGVTFTLQVGGEVHAYIRAPVTNI